MLTVLSNLQVGAGPSGLILALTLRRNGIPVRVIEKTTEHRKGQRGAGIMVCGRSINSTVILFHVVFSCSPALSRSSTSSDYFPKSSLARSIYRC